MVNIKVAVRIRPLSQREILRGEEIIVQRENKSVLVTNPKIPERQDGDSRQRTRRFAVDFCYEPEDPETCTQEAVYKEIGLEVLDSMFDGYNACVLAYGHSASGKTYTIMGLQDDPGLTPRLCQGLFEKLQEKPSDGGVRVQVAVSFLEIYNEKVRDLLGNEETGPTSGNFSLRVREHPKLGPYVQGLSEHLVTDKRKLLALLAAGNKRRRTAATENNVHSSRSHAVFTIQFKQSDGEKYETEKSSKLHLVDLAGSLQDVSQQETVERASSSQSKARLKEGANINKSLVTLGYVISALAESYESGSLLKEHSSLKSWQPFVPYRDSVLTWLLKDTLGGNSNTIMIATISPASGCLSETVNTLRYAKRTKRIVNQPIVNEDPKTRTIRQLRKEIARLKRLLLSFQSCSTWCQFEENDFEETIGFSSPESKWLEPGGTRITIEKDHCNKRANWQQAFVEGEEPNERKIIAEGKNYENFESNAYEQGVDGRRVAPRGIGDEKKPDVNGSVNDNFSHETQIFSDSLESFSSAFLKSGNSCDADDDGEVDADTPRGNLSLRLSSSENLSKDFSAMLHRSRPDLIKGISTRSKDSLPSGSSQSCTDLSQSASENSLNSSGSTDVQQKTSTSENGAGGKSNEKGISRKKEKRSDIVEAVTSRLYVPPKKPETRRKDEEDEGELCKRARMKLFDLSRKLAMTRKVKTTIDNDTQTEEMRVTLRVKDKSVTTDPSDASDFEGVENPEEKKPCVIMNQVFIPHSSNYVVECGNVVRIETPDTGKKQESATQTGPEMGTYKNANTSPVKFSLRDEDSFSEDSLDIDDKNKTSSENRKPEAVSFNWPPNSEVYFSCESEKRFREESKTRNHDVMGDSSEGSKKENLSSENSFTSIEGTDVSETSSEDFVFYESSKDAGVKTDRELYTITENSEQSDPSEAFSPIQGYSECSRRPNDRDSKIEQVPKTVSPKPNAKCPDQVPNADDWTEQSDSYQQYLNISTSNKAPFSVDTNLTSRKDQSTDTMFNSSDSITFVFMGPAKPKTSVLMEIIRRSLGEIPSAQRESKSKGVQCDASLMRSVSVDTAMIALSRIAKNQQSSLQRTTSLNGLSVEESIRARKSAMKCSVGTNTIPEQTKHRKPDEEKPKKTVSWMGETKHDIAIDPVEEPNERRVRFLKQETDERPNDNLTAFLKEVTQLLKNINSRSSEGSELTMRRSKTESCLEKDVTLRSKPADRKSDAGESNLTWPRRRQTNGKPPTGLRPKPPRSPPRPRAGSWNLSNLSLENTRNETKWSRESPGVNVPQLNLDFISELESELEDSCRRLELAAEEDRMRERLFENRFENRFEKSELKKKPEVLRRRSENCAGTCTCATETEPCKHLWSKGCRSTFELDSFGPGTGHCRQHCMFCRKKEAEAYHSVLNVNSECTSDLCRLNSYGFCPCSSVRLGHVVSSPRAYMQRLLALRRQIVNETKEDEKPRGFFWRRRTELSGV